MRGNAHVLSLHGPAEGLGRICAARRASHSVCEGTYPCSIPAVTEPSHAFRNPRPRSPRHPRDRRGRAAGDRPHRADRRQRARAVRRFGSRHPSRRPASAGRRTHLARRPVAAAVDELARRGRHHVHRRDRADDRSGAARPDVARVGRPRRAHLRRPADPGFLSALGARGSRRRAAPGDHRPPPSGARPAGERPPHGTSAGVAGGSRPAPVRRSRRPRARPPGRRTRRGAEGVGGSRGRARARPSAAGLHRRQRPVRSAGR